MAIAIKEQIQKVYNLALDALLPPRCSGCGQVAYKSHFFCGQCWANIQLIQKPWCQKCGVAMPFGGQDLSCVNCLNYPPEFSGGRSATRYEGLARDLVLRLKHADSTHLPKSLASWMAQVGQDFWADTDYLVPVPLHRWRLFSRRYNQATLLARALSNRVDIPVLTNVLIRKKRTQSQGRKSRQERHKNVKDAFEVQDPRTILKGKTVTLIDDVWTTGATLEACTKMLKQSGVDRVYVLTLSRVVKD